MYVPALDFQQQWSETDYEAVKIFLLTACLSFVAIANKGLILYNSNFTNFLRSDWLFARLYTSIKAVRKNTRFSSENWRDVT